MLVKNFGEGDVGMGSTPLRLFLYRDKTKTIEQMAATSFFDDVRLQLRVDDLIFCAGDDGEMIYKVTAVNDTAPYIEIDNFSPLASYVVATGKITTVGGSATETFTVEDISSSNIVTTQLIDDGTNNVSILTANTGTDQISVTFSGDPGSDTVFGYIVTVSL